MIFTQELQELINRHSMEGGSISAEQNRLRLMWLANAVLACDYGDNDTGHIGWRIRSDVRDEPLLFGPSINAAIDAAIAMEAGTRSSESSQ